MIGVEKVTETRVDKLAKRLKADVFMDIQVEDVDRIVADFQSKKLSETSAISELRKLQGARPGLLLLVDRESLPRDWNEIAGAIAVSEQRYLKKAEQQFYIGTFGLPVALVVVIASLLIGWQGDAGAAVTAGLLGAGLASLAAHAFFVLRVHQQASTAAERLSEKRLALLFLKLALSSEGEERKSLLEAGTSMFLGHQAPETIPLSPQDFKLPADRNS